jgi:hypothetical protein
MRADRERVLGAHIKAEAVELEGIPPQGVLYIDPADKMAASFDDQRHGLSAVLLDNDVRATGGAALAGRDELRAVLVVDDSTAAAIARGVCRDDRGHVPESAEGRAIRTQGRAERVDHVGRGNRRPRV